MKSILYVIGSMEIGGAEKHLFSVINELKSEQFIDPEIFVFNRNGPLLANYESINVTVHSVDHSSCMFSWLHRFSIFKYITIVFSLIGIMKRKNYDIHHFFLPASYILGGISSLLSFTSAKTIMSRRSRNFYQNSNKIYALAEKFLHKHINYAVANSNIVLQDLICEGMPKEKLRLIYNGCKPNLIAKQLTKKSKYTAVIIANLIPYKGHLDLFEAIGILRDDYKFNLNLLVVGHGTAYQQVLQRKVNQLFLNDQIVFLGQQKDVHEHIYKSDFGVLSSHEEGFSNALLEIMSNGLPVVATTVGANTELIINNYNGFLCSPNAPEELAIALKQMCASDIRILGLNAYRTIVDKFTFDEMINGYKSLYTFA